MRYVILYEGKLVNTFETNSNDYTLESPGGETIAVEVGEEAWQDIIAHPESYSYKDGQVTPVDT